MCSFQLVDTLPNLSRELIQNEWTMIARRAGAAGLEFVNDVDDEEVPPGIGVLLPYVERSYLLYVVSPRRLPN